MFMLDYKDYGWWYWLVSSICLWLTLTVDPLAYNLALIIAVVQLVHFSIAEGGLTKFPVQIRLGYLSFLLISMPESMQWMLWLPAVGTVARVVFGYCLMARMLMLMPFNREIELSWNFVKEAFLTAPVRGSILHGLPALKTAG